MLLVSSIAERGFTALMLGLLLPVCCAQGGESDRETIAYQARAVLRRHCQECHGEQQPRAGLNILDHDVLTVGRALVLPGTANPSELLERIEEGSMPPGRHPKLSAADRLIVRRWIEAGAPYFPGEPSETAILSALLEDVGRLREKDSDLTSQPRYISLNHLLAQDDPLPTLNAYRRALEYAVRSLAQRKLAEELAPLVKVDRAGTLYRISLRDLGWDRAMYDTAIRSTPDPLHLDFYDGALLAYPYAVFPPKTPLYGRVQQEFLGRIRQIRPLPYLRGDWLIGAMWQRPAQGNVRPLPWYPDATHDSVQDAARRYAAPLDLATALAELGPQVPLERLRDAVVAKIDGLSTLSGNGGTIERAAWEQAFPLLQQRLGIVQPMWAIDDLPRPAVVAESLKKDVKLVVYDLTQKEETTTLKPGQRFRVSVTNRSDYALFVEVVWRSALKDAMVMDRKADGPGEVVRLEPGTEVHFPAEEEGLLVGEDPGEDRFTLLAAEQPFERGVREALSDLQIPNRIVHPAVPSGVRQMTIVTTTSRP